MSLRNNDATRIKQLDEALAAAVKKNWIDVVKMVIAIPGVDINSTAKNNKQVSHVTSASGYGHTDIVRIFLNTKTCSTNSINSSLIVAAREGHKEILKLLLTVGDINTVNKSNASLLYVAALNNRAQIVKLLLAYDNIDLDIIYDSKTALTIAQEKSYTRIANNIIAAYAKKLLNAPDKEVSPIVLASLVSNRAALFAALMRLPRTDQLKAVKQILEEENSALAKIFRHGNDRFPYLKNADYKMVEAKHLELTLSPELSDTEIWEIILTNKKTLDGDVLLKWLNQVDITKLVPAVIEKLKAYKTPLLEAIKALPDEEAFQMLEKIFSKDRNDTALGKVFWAGHADKFRGRLGDAYDYHGYLKHLLQPAREKFASAPDEQYTAALFHAALTNNAALANILLTTKSEELDVNTTNAAGNTALTLAVWKGNIEVIRELKMAKNLDANFGAFPPLTIAAEKSFELFELLLEFDGIDINGKNVKNATAIILAARNEFAGSAKIVKLLLTYENIDLNVVSRSGSTALGLACENSCIEMVDAIIDVYAKQLLRVPNTKLPTAVLEHLESHKQKLFAALQSSDPTITIEKVMKDKKSALAKIFLHNCADLIDGRKIAFEKITLTPKISAEIFDSLIAGKKDISGDLLLQWLNEVDISDKSILAPSIITHLKKYYKTPLLDAIKALKDDSDKLIMLEKIFDESKTDKKNIKTALGIVFWAGTTNLYEKRLGEAYAYYFSLKFPGKKFEKPSYSTNFVGTLFNSFKSSNETKSETAEDFYNLDSAL